MSSAGATIGESMAMFLQLLVYSRLGERGIAARRKLRTEEIDTFADLDLFRQVGRLQAHADAVFELLALRAGIDPENRDLASAAWTDAFENFDRGGFAGAVRAEKSEDLACADFKVDAFDGGFSPPTTGSCAPVKRD